VLEDVTVNLREIRGVVKGYSNAVQTFANDNDQEIYDIGMNDEMSDSDKLAALEVLNFKEQFGAILVKGKEHAAALTDILLAHRRLSNAITPDVKVQYKKVADTITSTTMMMDKNLGMLDAVKKSYKDLRDNCSKGPIIDLKALHATLKNNLSELIKFRNGAHSRYGVSLSDLEGAILAAIADAKGADNDAARLQRLKRHNIKDKLSAVRAEGLENTKALQSFGQRIPNIGGIKHPKIVKVSKDVQHLFSDIENQYHDYLIRLKKARQDYINYRDSLQA